MGWLLFQGLVFLAVYWSNLEWGWAENDNLYVVAVFGIGAALGATVIASWIIERLGSLASRRRPPAEGRFD